MLIPLISLQMHMGYPYPFLLIPVSGSVSHSLFNSGLSRFTSGDECQLILRNSQDLLLIIHPPVLYS